MCEKYTCTLYHFSQNKPLGRQCSIQRVCCEVTSIQINMATYSMLCHQNMQMQKTMEPNGLTRECCFEQFWHTEAHGATCIPSSTANGLDCFAISNQCEGQCSCKKKMYTVKQISSKDLQHLTFGNTELHWQHVHLFLHILCRNPMS